MLLSEARSRAFQSRPNRIAAALETVRPEVKAQLIADGGEGKPKEVVQAIAAKWKALSDEEKASWNEKAKTPPASEEDDA